jgi:hypothetical protein
MMVKKTWFRGLVRRRARKERVVEQDFWSSLYQDVKEALLEDHELLDEIKRFLSKRHFLSSSWFDLSRFERIVEFADRLGVNAFDVVDIAEEIIEEENL